VLTAGASDRRLVAIMAADVVGYSRMVAADEAGTLARLRALRGKVIDPQMAAHGGRVFKTTGDGLLAEFASAVQALRCAIAIQEKLCKHAGDDEALQLRIGLHAADVVVQDGDLLGDGVNVAARLELLAEPGGICISARVREDAAGKITLEVEDIGEPALKNMTQKVRVFRVRRSPAPSPLPAPTLPDKPSLAVLPFTNMSGEAEQEYFADGVVEDIITALSRSRGLFVIARNSSFTYKGRAVDIRQVGRDLGVRYVLEGSVRSAGGRIRITGKLIEAATGGHIWGDRFEGGLADIFDLQDRITESVVGAIEPKVEQAEIARASAKATERLDTYDLYLRALPHYRSLTKPGMDAAIELLQRALEIDPSYVRAKALLSSLYLMRIEQGWGAPDDRDVALTLGNDAINSGTDDPEALVNAGWALAILGDHAGGRAALDRALRLHPNYAKGLARMGFACILSNNPEEAIGCFEHAILISPLDPEMGLRLSGLGGAHLMVGHNDQALALLQRAVQEARTSKWTHRNLIQALTRMGRLDEATAAAARLLEIDPSHRVGPLVERNMNPKYNEERRLALLAAGLPE
jgi:adenylate cyclase